MMKSCLILKLAGIWLFLAVPRSASAQTALRLSPTHLHAQLSGRLLIFENRGEDWMVGGTPFSPQQFHAKWENSNRTFRLQWNPQNLSPDQVQIRTRQGKILAEHPYSGPTYLLTENQSALQLEAKNATTLNEKQSSGAQLMIDVPSGQAASFATLLICATETRAGERAEVCAPAQRDPAAKSNILIAKKKIWTGAGEVEFKAGEEIAWRLTLANQISFTTRFNLPVAVLHEVRLGQEGDLDITFYSEMKPAMKFSLLTPERSWFFKPTIGDLRKLYAVTTPLDVPYLTFQGPFGIKIRQKVAYKELIQTNSQIFLAQNTPRTTYGSQVTLEGEVPEGYRIAPGQDQVTLLDDRRFEWIFPTPQKREMNLAEIEISPVAFPDKVIRYDYEVYRGSSTYLSTRLGASLTSNLGFSGALDLQALHWFNEPFGRNSFSRQRWGIAAGYAQTLLSTSEKERYKTSNLTTYFRFTPGLDNWTETFGLWAGAINFQYRDTQETSLLGGGLFWSRSLPPWFNYFLGWTSFLRNPKWVHFSGGLYPVSLTSGVQAYLVEAKAVGRIEISRQTFFEGGWAVVATTSSYRENNGTVQVTMGAGRGYLGFGYQF